MSRVFREVRKVVFLSTFPFSLMIRLLFNLSYFQLNLDPGSVSVKSWGTLHLINFHKD